jgi:hypothetical protein
LRTSAEATPEIQSLRAEQETALASHDFARFKQLERQIQALNPCHVQPRPVEGGPVPAGPPRVAAGLGPVSDIPIYPGLVYGSAADYGTDGTMWAAFAEQDSAARCYKSTDHGATWSYVNGLAWTPKSLITKIQLVVGQGDSDFVYMFAMSPAGNGQLWLARFNQDGSNFVDYPVIEADADTLDDFAVCRDFSGADYYLYAIAVDDNRTHNEDNGFSLRSIDYGKTWTPTDTWVRMTTPSLSAGAGAWIYLIAAYNNAGNEGRLALLINHTFGHGFWFETDVYFDTFDVSLPACAAAFTLPESTAVIWAAYDHYDTARADYDLLAAASTDGGFTFGAPVAIAAFPNSHNVGVDLKNYTSLGNPYVDIAYFSLDWATNYRRVYRNFVDAGNPNAWSDTLRINSAQAYTTIALKPKLVDSPGGPGSGAGCIFAHYDFGVNAGDSGFFNAPWATGIAEGRMQPAIRAASITAMPNPFRTRVEIRLAPGLVTERAAEFAIYNAGGRLVRRLAVPEASSGEAVELTWDRTDSRGRKVSPGVYLARLVAGMGSVTRALTVQ